MWHLANTATTCGVLWRAIEMEMQVLQNATERERQKVRCPSSGVFIVIPVHTTHGIVNQVVKVTPTQIWTVRICRNKMSLLCPRAHSKSGHPEYVCASNNTHRFSALCIWNACNSTTNANITDSRQRKLARCANTMATVFSIERSRTNRKVRRCENRERKKIA